MHLFTMITEWKEVGTKLNALHYSVGSGVCKLQVVVVVNRGHNDSYHYC